MSHRRGASAAPGPHRAWGALATVLALAAAAGATLLPTDTTGEWTESVTFCLFCGELGGVDFLLNVLLFVPLGFALRLSGLTPRRAIGVAFATSLLIESLQLHVVSGRDSSLGDLVANTVGGAVGALLTDSWRSWIRPSPPAALRLLTGGVALWLLMLAGTAWALRRSMPHTLYYSQWAADLQHLARFEGTVASATLNGASLPPGPLERSPVLRFVLAGDSARVDASALAGPPTAGLAPIVSIHDHRRTEVLLLGQWERDLVYRMRLRASDLKLRAPVVTLSEAFPHPPARRSAHSAPDTLRLAGGFRDNQLFALVERGDRAKEAILPLSPTIGWSLLWPLPFRQHRLVTALSVAWTAVWLLPLGYWGAFASFDRQSAARSGRRRSTVRRSIWLVSLLAISIAGGFWALPWLLSAASVPAPVWIGAAAALLTGFSVGLFSAGSRDRNARAVRAMDPAHSARERSARAMPL